MTLAGFAILCGLQTLVGFAYDAVVGDPHGFPHPARLVGRLIAWQEVRLRRRFRNLRMAGGLLCLGTTFVTAFCTAALMAALAMLDIRHNAPSRWFSDGFGTIPWFSIVGGGIVCGIWFSWRSLGAEARKIRRLLQTGLIADARRELSMIVGRDTGHLDEKEIVRAVVETVAENAVDGGISPVFYALLGGPVGVSLFKAASTLDSMVGYRNEKYRDLGMVSARLDDVLNFAPARLALVLIPAGALLAGLNPLRSLRIGIRDHAQHPSPNSGYGESLFAGAMGLQLGGQASYGGVPSRKPLLGDRLRESSSRDIARAGRLLYSTGAIVAVLVAAGVAAIWP